MNPSVAILIVNYNGASFVMKAIESALAQVYDGSVEIIVVDNASTDDSVMLLRATPGIRLLENHANRGYGAGVNFALPSINAEYIAFLNPDAQALPAWLATMIPFMVERKIAIASSIISAGSGTYFASGRYFAALGVSVDSPKVRDETDWVTGCALVASRAALESLGGFDDGFFLYYEDVDLCLRARQRGMSLEVLREALVDHPHSGGSANALGRRRKLEIFYNSRGRFIRKHVSRWLHYPALLAALLLAAFRNGIPIAWMSGITQALFCGFRSTHGLATGKANT